LRTRALIGLELERYSGIPGVRRRRQRMGCDFRDLRRREPWLSDVPAAIQPLAGQDGYQTLRVARLRRRGALGESMRISRVLHLEQAMACSWSPLLINLTAWSSHLGHLTR